MDKHLYKTAILWYNVFKIHTDTKKIIRLLSEDYCQNDKIRNI